MKLNHASDSMSGALGISTERHRYIHGLIWWSFVYNHHLKTTLYENPDDVPDNLKKKSAIVEFLLNELPDSEAERLLAVYEFQKIDTLTDNEEMAQMGLSLCFAKAELLKWNKEDFIKFFCENMLQEQD